MAEEKRERGEMTVAEAGRKGGEKVASRRGREFYSAIGHKGGAKGGQRVSELVGEGRAAEKK
jgi:hypothetical protein